jgi:hypothetical protein
MFTANDQQELQNMAIHDALVIPAIMHIHRKEDTTPVRDPTTIWLYKTSVTVYNHQNPINQLLFAKTHNAKTHPD